MVQRAGIVADAGCSWRVLPVTVAHRAGIAADQAADAGKAMHGASGVAVADAIGSEDVRAEQTAYIALAAGAAHGVAVGDGAPRVEANQASHGVLARRDIAAGVAAIDHGDGTAIAQVAADQAADTARAADIAGGIAAHDAAAKVLPDQATDVIVASHRGAGVAVADQAGAESDQGADGELAIDATAQQTDIADKRAVVRETDQTHVIGAWPVDVQAADGIAAAIQAACEGMAVVADGHETGSRPDILASRRAGRVDVSAQHICCARRHGH